ncbi:MAG: hypothetical protein PHD95_05615 [Candidatus ainarchaeum sp.]|nr:hypothetical protein [Candidatus ainarchaeum sp.]
MPAKKPARISGTARGKATINLSQGRGIRGRIVLNLGSGKKPVPKKSLTGKGGKKMPPTGRPTRKPVQPKIPHYDIPGQKAQFTAQGSKYWIKRKKDEFAIQAAKRPKVRYV